MVGIVGEKGQEREEMRNKKAGRREKTEDRREERRQKSKERRRRKKGEGREERIRETILCECTLKKWKNRPRRVQNEALRLPKAPQEAQKGSRMRLKGSQKHLKRPKDPHHEFDIPYSILGPWAC